MILGVLQEEFLNLHHLSFKSMGFGGCAHPQKLFLQAFGSHLPDYMQTTLKGNKEALVGGSIDCLGRD